MAFSVLATPAPELPEATTPAPAPSSAPVAPFHLELVFRPGPCLTLGGKRYGRQRGHLRLTSFLKPWSEHVLSLSLADWGLARVGPFEPESGIALAHLRRAYCALKGNPNSLGSLLLCTGIN